MTKRLLIRRARTAAAALTVAVALAGCGDDDADDQTATTPTEDTTDTTDTTADESTTSSTPGATVVEVEFAGGEVVGGPGTEAVTTGDPVELRITSDTADEVHVHGYDLTAELTPGQKATIEFTADIPGVFEVELHDAGLLLVNLEVSD